MSLATDELPVVNATALASMEPYGEHIPPGDDLPTEELHVARVIPGRNGWEIRSEEGWCCSVARVRRSAPIPEPGDLLITYGGLGRQFQGMRLVKPSGVDEVLWYRNATQRDEHRRRQLDNIRAEREREFERTREQRDRQVTALPPKFRARIERFRAADPEFRVESEGYELFILVEAAKFAQALGTEAAVREFSELTFDEQQARHPGLVSDGHSGNTHACAMRFAIALINDEDV